MNFGIGQSVPRTEDLRLLTECGVFVDDIILPNMTHAIVVYSPIAHGEFRTINPSTALVASGVLAVLNGDDAVVDDLGRLLNPLLAEGQIHGGVVQGIGQALLENVHYEPDTGQLLSGSLMDYCLPRTDDLPWLETDTHELPCTTDPIKVKGGGEGGTVGATPAVISAVLDALAPLGVTDINLPATPERIWHAMNPVE